MTYAVVNIQGKQLKVKEGDIVEVDRLDGKPGDKLVFDQVLLFVDGDKREFGNPVLPMQVEAEVVENKKGDKIRVATYKAKSRYRRVIGHRQSLTTLKITKIQPAKAAKKTKPSSPAK